MRTSTILLALTLTGTPISQGRAQEPPRAEAPGPIQTTADMREAAWKEFSEAEAQLNRVYQKVMTRLEGAGQKTQLQKAQQAWLKFREAQAEFEASFCEGGSIQPQIQTACRTGLTRNRAKDLQHILDTAFEL